MTQQHKAKRISPGHYIYRGFAVHSVGYHEPEHCVCWEAIDKDGWAFAHSHSLADTKAIIDKELEEAHDIASCSMCKHYQALPNQQMWCGILQRGITARKRPCINFQRI